MAHNRSFLLAGAACLLSLAASGFNEPRVVEGPMTAEIADPGKVMALGKPINVPVALRNGGSTALTGVVKVAVTDDWRIEGRSEAPFSVPAGGGTNIPFAVVPGSASYAALYPVHAEISCHDGQGGAWALHPILITEVSPSACERTTTGQPVIEAPLRGPIRLDEQVELSRVTIAVNGTEPVDKPIGWIGADVVSGSGFSVTEAMRGDSRRAWAIHPPYRKGWGETWVDYSLKLPDSGPIRVAFATAIRDHDPAREGASDGVDFRVGVGVEGKFENRFARFSAAKVWEPAVVDISSYAGRQVTLRFITGPGPKHNTSCDSCFWAEPSLWVGPDAAVEEQAARDVRRGAVVAAARVARAGKLDPWSWRLCGENGAMGASLNPGPGGITDAFIAFSDGERELILDGFEIEIDGSTMGGRNGLPIVKTEPRFDGGAGEIMHEVILGKRTVKILARVWEERGTWRVAFSMPGVERDSRGEPRYSRLSVGPGSSAVRRVYAGFGNVIQDPDPKGFELRAGGFTLCTRHVGADYDNGMSLVQATDIFPDLLAVKPGLRHCALVTHHDATITLVPSCKGSFDAARAYRGVAGFKPGGGVSRLLDRMCVDQWGGDYGEAAAGIEKLASYGVTNAVFVKHVWQRWGYDYRLPEIYPPAGDATAFISLAKTCRRAGILFAPHDNYIDFYPDAAGFSYRHVMFGRGGTPQKAWFNEGRKAQSYRWLPTAFFPWMETNLAHARDDIGATSYFVDVFSAIPPLDFHDREGRFYPKTICQERWAAAFDRIRDALGGNAPTISEAGHDGLIGHLDAGEADHNGWSPEGGHGGWHIAAADGERVPWHDMASHGSFVLFAGGLGHRYAGKENDQMLHGYGSDDYLNMTALGGRNPMCDGPFSRRTVMTHWLLSDVCARLARSEMLEHHFANGDIHRQTVRFSGDGVVHANRGEADWEVEGLTLPRYGFLARGQGVESSVASRGGVISAFATSPGILFADARPPVDEARPVAEARVKAIEDLGRGRFRLRMEWRILREVERGARSFAHFDHPGKDHESIAFQATLRPDVAMIRTPGIHEATCEASIPAGQKVPATFLFRCGLYVPGLNGARLPMARPTDSGGRATCGRIIAAQGGKVGDMIVRWEAETDRWFAVRQARINHERKIVDFGPVATDGAFRLQHMGKTWQLIPLPQSEAFEVRLRLDLLGAGGAKTFSIAAFGNDGKETGEVAARRQGDVMSFKTAEGVHGYRISIGR